MSFTRLRKFFQKAAQSRAAGETTTSDSSRAATHATTTHGSTSFVASAGTSSASGADKRAYDRYRPRDRDALAVDFGDGTRAEIRDVSYGGFAARMAAPSQNARAEDGCKIRLDAWGEVAWGRASLVYVADGVSAFVLHHETPDVLLFLRNFIERLRQGRTLSVIAKDNLNPPYNEATWTCLRGEGATEVRLHTDDRGRLVEAVLTATDRGDEMEVTFRHGRVAYSGSAAGRTIGSFPERAAIRTAAAILAGADLSATNPAANQVLDAFYRVLKAELTAPLARLVRAG
jgi:hypothetical protein